MYFPMVSFDEFFISHTSITNPTNFILPRLITLTIFRDLYKLLSSFTWTSFVLPLLWITYTLIFSGSPRSQ